MTTPDHDEAVLRDVERFEDDGLGAPWRGHGEAERILGVLDRLGYTVVPVTVPAEAPRIAGDELEGSEATTGAERAVLERA